MGVQKTNLNSEKIKDILNKMYNIKVLNITKIERGTSNIFKIESYKNKYILKEFISTRKKENIIKEINIINFLKQRDINVPIYVKTIKGDSYVENEGRIIIIQEFIEGYTINNTSDYKKILECANIFGKLTKELIKYPELSKENFIEKSFSKNRVDLGIKKMEELKNNIKENNIYKEQIEKDIDYRIKVLKELKDNFNFEVINKLTILNSHGDFCVQQLIYNDKKEPTIIDFEKAKKLPIVWEVIRSYSYISKNKNTDTLIDYFKEFNKYIKLNQYDLKYAPYIFLIQLASSVYGYEEYNEDFTQKELLEFAMFRTNLTKDLYENAKEISSRLIKEI